VKSTEKRNSVQVALRPPIAQTQPRVAIVPRGSFFYERQHALGTPLLMPLACLRWAPCSGPSNSASPIRERPRTISVITITGIIRIWRVIRIWLLITIAAIIRGAARVQKAVNALNE
jgi:hypothetical protein